MVNVCRLCCLVCVVTVVKPLEGVRISANSGGADSPELMKGHPETGGLTEVEIEQLATTGYSDDGLQVFPEGDKPSEKDALPDSTMFTSGFEAARKWNKCKHKLKFSQAGSEHYIDSAASGKYNFIYVDNVKAGSSSIRQVLAAQLHVDWWHTDIPGAANHTGHGGRYSSRDFGDFSQMFKFSVVRDPVAKFESGVRQAWRQNPQKYKGMSADEVLEDVISNSESFHNRGSVFGNEHLEPSSYRLSTFDANIPPTMADLDFIGKLEHMDTDWPGIVDGMTHFNNATKDKLKGSLGKENAHPHDPLSKLTETGIRRMCASSIYRFEWECFDYELPHVCN